MTSPSQLDAMLAGRRVLFVNAIRSDVPSGGGTATAAMLGRLRHSGLRELRQFELNPPAGGSRTTFALATIPAMFIVLLSRLTGHVWLEFFLRLSPWLFLRCWIAATRWRPDVVILNHHAAFPYARVFRTSHRVLVWHDVPSLKRDGERDRRRDARICAGIERSAVACADLNVTFSFDDARALRMLHHRKAVVLPVIDTSAAPRDVEARPGRWLLVGNWTRAENCEGAALFLASCAGLAREGTARTATFHIAGHGAQDFVERLKKAKFDIAALDVRVTARYGEMRDFDEFALLAPLLRGAGIKLKTVEAWAAGIPVVGTAQAFTGLPARIWRKGGLRVESVADMARLCMNCNEADATVISELEPISAYYSYQNAVRASASGA